MMASGVGSNLYVVNTHLDVDEEGINSSLNHLIPHYKSGIIMIVYNLIDGKLEVDQWHGHFHLLT